MKRNQRLQVARAWIPTYTGKDIVKGYRNWFHVDKLCALEELRLCGISIPEERIEQARQEIKRLYEERRRKKEVRSNKTFSHYEDYDDRFAYIAGYTPAGFPYGVTWEEMEQSNINETECDDKTPFD